MFEHHSNTPKPFTSFNLPQKRSFLSPANKYGHRSFSASSLTRQIPSKPQQGSLREQIKLDSFKKNIN